MRKIIISGLLLVLVSTHIYALRKSSEAGKLIMQSDESSFVVPPQILRVTALDYRGLASDLMFIKGLVFFGRTFERKEKPKVKDWEWRWMYNVLDASTGLDPYFFDPYYFANATLTWSAGLIKETNALLEKGSRSRNWDYRLPFYIGFNQFWFLQETDSASEHLMEASRRPDASPLFASLAARLAYKGHKTSTAILFLEEMLNRATDNDERKYYEARIEVLKAVQQMETAVAKYKTKFGKVPADLNELIAKKIIDHIPQVPYGGSFYIDSHGEVKATSQELLSPRPKMH